MGKLEALKEHIQNVLDIAVGNRKNDYISSKKELEAFARKQRMLNERNFEIVKANGNVQIVGESYTNLTTNINYILHTQYLLKNKNEFILEEKSTMRKAIFKEEELKSDEPILYQSDQTKQEVKNVSPSFERQRVNYIYDRRAAVQYAELWWNNNNPAYRKFDVNCTNYISQCVRAGQVPMRGYPNRGDGWWYSNNNWSYSWAVAHSFRWYLSGSTKGLQAQEVPKATDLNLGDIICYDFQGTGKYDHTTIVVAKDSNGEPLVNANTNNSRMRYWTYVDSMAWTPNIKYKFFHIKSADERNDSLSTEFNLI